MIDIGEREDTGIPRHCRCLGSMEESEGTIGLGLHITEATTVHRVVGS